MTGLKCLSSKEFNFIDSFHIFHPVYIKLFRATSFAALNKSRKPIYKCFLIPRSKERGYSKGIIRINLLSSSCDYESFYLFNSCNSRNS